MGYGFNKNGQYDLWSPISDYSTKEQLNALENLPLPIGTVAQWSPTIEGASDISEEFNKYATYISFLKHTDKTLENIILDLPTEVIDSIGNVLYKIKENNKLFINNSNSNNEQFKDLFLNLLNAHNTDLEYINKDNAIKNSIVAKIKKIISMPSNQLLSTEPVSIQQLHDGAKAAKDKLGFKEDPMSLWDGITPYKQQTDASIGKADVGISANGMKVFFSLSNYYNSYYADIKSGKKIIENVLTDNKSFLKSFKINDKIRKVYTIANVDVPEEYQQEVLNRYGFKNLQAQEIALSKEQAALIASGIISGATDNAKELVMAKINAVVDLAGMHMYLVALGYSMDDVAIYMNSDLARNIAKDISGNIFVNSKKPMLDTLLDKYEEDSKVSDNTKLSEEIKQFRDIHLGANEFRVLSGVLQANQKTSADMVALNKFLSKLENAIFSGENNTLGKNLINLRQENLWEGKYTFKDSPNRITLIDRIINNNLLFKQDPEGSKEYIRKVLQKSSSINVDYTTTDNKTSTKTVSILGGQFDFRHYMHPDNEEYREAVINYANLFKNTINVFDVIENSPHFKAMVDGISTMHNILATYSEKYNTTFNKMRDLVKDNAERLVKSNDDLHSKFLNPAFTIDTSEVTLSKEFRAFDIFAVAKWLKSSGEISKFRFNVQDLLEKADVPKVTLYTSNEAKYFTSGEIKTYKSLSKISKSLITIDKNYTGDFIVDLTTDYGIANFKILTEEVLLKILDNSEKNNLAKSLKLISMSNPLGLNTIQIVPTYTKNSIDSDKYNDMMSDFNEVDSKIEPTYWVKNAEGKRIKYKDLLFVYNLTVNNEVYGDKRLTSLLKDYVSDRSTIAHDYLLFCADIDAKREKLFDLGDKGTTSEEINSYNEREKAQTDALLFASYNKNGWLNLGKGPIILKNPNFIINTDMRSIDRGDSPKYITLDQISSLLKNRNLIINFNCD